MNKFDIVLVFFNKIDRLLTSSGSYLQYFLSNINHYGIVDENIHVRT